MGESYFKIKKDLEPKITGLTKDGGDQGKIDIHLFKDKLWLNEFLYGYMSGLRRGDFPEKEFTLEGIWLDKKAKLNEFISVGALMTGFIVNQKVVEILKTCTLPPHKFYEVTFNQAGKIIEGYYWFYFNLFDGKHHINYSQTIFDTKKVEQILVQDVIIQNYEDYIRVTLAMDRAIHVEKIVFDKSFNLDLDFFGMRFFGNGSYISDRLKKKFEINKIKGFRLNEPIDPILEWE
jgi:hypothetical protein